jgi:uncharacterized membrane protein YccC
MKKIKLPSTTILILASLAAFWLADMVNPSFNSIGIGILLLIPVFMIDFLYPRSNMERLLEQINSVSLESEEPNEVETEALN